jgi:hypothetical protein
VKTGMVNSSTLVTKRPWNLEFHPEGFLLNRFHNHCSHETFKPV